MKRRGRYILALPATLACLSGKVVTEGNFFYTIGPLISGQSAQFELRFKVDRYPNGYCYLDIEIPGPTGKSLLKTQSTSRYRADAYGFSYFRVTLPATLYGNEKRAIFHFGIAKVPYTRDLDLGQRYLIIQNEYPIEEADPLFRLDGRSIHEMSHSIHVYDASVDSKQAFVYHDAFALADNRSKHFLNADRRLPLDLISVEYHNVYALNKSSPSAELRILSHLDEFEEISADRGGFRAMPLKVTITETSYGEQYDFSLAELVWYSQVDYRARKTIPLGEPYFRSDHFYVPLRLGHDTDTYHFQIFFRQGGAYKDSFYIPLSLSKSTKKFGPCASAEYCVVIGS